MKKTRRKKRLIIALLALAVFLFGANYSVAMVYHIDGTKCEMKSNCGMCAIPVSEEYFSFDFPLFSRNQSILTFEKLISLGLEPPTPPPV